MDKVGDNPTDEEVKKEEEKFKGLCLLKRSDMLRFGTLLNELHNASYASRYDYPTLQS